MKILTVISCFILGIITCTAQSNLDFEQWVINYNNIDETKFWINTSDASRYNAPQVMFKETNNPASGLASVILTTAYWKEGSTYGLDTLVGSLMQQADYTKRPKGFTFSYKANPHLGDEVLVGVQLTMTINDTMIVVGEGFFTSSEKQDNWKSEHVDINYYSGYTPDNINIIALSSANAVILDGSNGYAKIGSTLYLDNLRLMENAQTISNNYYMHVFPNPAKSHLNISTNAPEAQLVEIYTLTGKLILSSSFTHQSEIDISILSSGTYIYKVSNMITQEVTASNKFNVIR